MKNYTAFAGVFFLLLAMSCSEGGKVVVESDGKGQADVQAIDGSLEDGQSELATVDGNMLDGVEPELVGHADIQGDALLDAVDTPDGTIPLDIPKDEGAQVFVSTYSIANSVKAGVPLGFECLVQGLPDGSYNTYLQLWGPAEVDVEDLDVTFKKVGLYKVACAAVWADGEVVDPTPVKIQVTAGSAATIQTQLSTNSAEAGDTVYATCTLKDEFGNVVDNAAMVVANPGIGLDIYGSKIIAVKAGSYQVTCVDPVSQLSDLTPEKLDVGWNVPRRIVTTLADNTIMAGDHTSVTCQAFDAYNNVVPDFPLSVFLAPGLTIDGFQVSGTTVGSYQVVCVPQGYDWELFDLNPQALNIFNAPAASVTLAKVPDKPMYKMFEAVEFVPTAVDAYGNMVEDAEILPIYYEPNHPDVVLMSENRYKFETEGTFEFYACLGNAPNVCGVAEVTVDGYGPVIVIETPGRGVTLNGKPAVAVQGYVIDEVSGVEDFSINGQHVPLDSEGNFSFVISSQQGLNFIVALAEDPSGFKTLHVQSYYYSPVWHKSDINDPANSTIHDGLLFHLGKEFFDRFPHNYSQPDNLSTILEMAIQTIDLGSFIPNPVVQSGPYKVYVGPFYYDPPMVSIYPRPGGMQAEARLHNIKIDVQAIGSCKILFIDLCPDVSGDVTVHDVELNLGLDISAQNGQISMQESDNFIAIYGLDVDIDGILGWLFDWLIDWFVDGYVEILEDTAMTMISDQITSITTSFLDELALETNLDIPNPLDPTAPPVSLFLTTVLQELEFDESGVTIRLDPAILAPKNVSHDTLGSIGRASCLNWLPEEFILDQDEWAHIGVFDDMLNQMLFSAWNSGLLSVSVPVDQFIDPSMLEGFGISSLSELGISNLSATTDFFLPPIITSCNGDDQLQMQVGDLYVQLNMNMLGQPVSIGMFVSMVAEADIVVEQGPSGPEVVLGVGAIDPAVMQVTYVSEGLQGAEGVLTMIVQGMLLPAILDSFAENTLVNFPIPEFNVSGFTPLLPPNIVWQFFVDEFYRELGYTSIIAHIEAL